MSHEPGRSVTFEFLGRPRGLHGHHQFVVQGTGPASCVLWHLTDLEPRFPMTVTWRLFWRPLHDALIEDALAKAQEAGGGSGAPRSRGRRTSGCCAGRRRRSSAGPGPGPS